MHYDITINLGVFIGFIVFCVSILSLLYRIGNAIYEQTEWLKQEDEIENIGN